MRRRRLIGMCLVLGWLACGMPHGAWGQNSPATGDPNEALAEIDCLTHVVLDPDDSLRDGLERLPHWLPWQPCMFDSSTVVWVDFTQLPAELRALRGKQTRYGVDLYALEVSCLIDGLPSDQPRLFWAASWEWPVDRQLTGLYYDLLRAKFGLRGQDQQVYQQLLAQGHGWLLPRLLTLQVWIGNAADRQTYQDNLRAEIAAWEEQERLARSTSLDSFSQTTLTSSSLLEAGAAPLMLLGNGCGITNDAAPFAVVVNAQTNGQMTVTWESCSTHLYGVYSREDLVTGSWQAQLWMIGLDGTSSWTDTNAPALNHFFYKVRRLTLDAADDDGDGLSNLDEFNTHGTDPGNPDTDGDGMPDGWELQYGFNPLNPADGSLDADGDGVSNSLEYVQGRDPTKPAVADLNNDVNLVVFTWME